MAKYRLTTAADTDIDRLFVFGVETFGLPKAETYITGLYDQLDTLAENPGRYPLVEHIHSGLHRCVYRSHSIYYRIHLTSSYSPYSRRKTQNPVA